MNYEKELEQIKNKNKKYLNEFKNWLKAKGLVEKTIKNHLGNVDFYINDYLNYYEITEMEEGCYELDSYLGDWFVRKCMWSTASSIKQNAASIKKFYLCMTELGHIERESYQTLCEEIKDNIDVWIEAVEDYNSFDLSGFF